MPTSPAFIPSDFPGDVTLDHVIPASSARFAALPDDLRPELGRALASRGIDRLYTHQADAYRAIRSGRHLVVVTPTASGKTLCYNLPVLQRLLDNPERRALYLFPTKALAQDQLAELSALKHGLPIELRVDTYDGDTAPGRRSAIREAGHVVMTNPDMLHAGVLPHHTRWRRLFSSLDFVVIEELARGEEHRAGRAQRSTAWRTPSHLLQPASAQPRDGRAAELDAGGATYSRAVDPGRGADHRLLPQPPAGRSDAQLPQAGPGAAPRRQPARARISRRLPAAAQA